MGLCIRATFPPMCPVPWSGLAVFFEVVLCCLSFKNPAAWDWDVYSWNWLRFFSIMIFLDNIRFLSNRQRFLGIKCFPLVVDGLELGGSELGEHFAKMKRSGVARDSPSRPRLQNIFQLLAEDLRGFPRSLP